MSNLTCIYYTSNQISERFFSNTRKFLLEAVGNIPIISISRKPIDLGFNICIGETEISAFNIYVQVLIGARAAKTKYVATVEDDVLYHPTHFVEYRPADDMIGYNKNKWSVYTWTQPPIYSFKDRYTLTSMIAPRALLIKTLEERFLKYPDINTFPCDCFGEPGRYEGNLGITRINREEWFSSQPNVVFSHEKALGYEHLGTRKKHGDKRTDTIPYWGHISNVINLYE